VSATPIATVVVVARDRWSQTPATLETLLARTDRRHRIVFVDGHAPRPVATVLDRLSASGRIRVVRQNHFLASNEARNLGAEGAETEWIAFVENDVIMSDGWLDVLLAAAEARDAATVYPVYLQPQRAGLFIHGTGSDLDVAGPVGARHLREHQHFVGRHWHEAIGEIEPAGRIQTEPHAIVIRREILERMGGFDEGLLSWFDHTDLALHHQRLGATAWLVPEVTCTYLGPGPIALTDLPSFALRWGADWYRRSLNHLCAVWGLNPGDSEWALHSQYRTYVRQSVPTPWRRVNAVIEKAATPFERIAARRWASRSEPVSVISGACDDA
jgi:GT2 family glycosyltransferase